jgi:membrane protein YdbS with pleckstrin-like domain
MMNAPEEKRLHKSWAALAATGSMLSVFTVVGSVVMGFVKHSWWWASPIVGLVALFVIILVSLGLATWWLSMYNHFRMTEAEKKAKEKAYARAHSYDY